MKQKNAILGAVSYERGGGMNGLALCAGFGGLERGIESLIPSSRTICYVEGETYPAAVLASKMEAGSLPKAPIWSNVRTFDGKPWRGKVSFISGGFPCQPYSSAGKQLAQKDPRDLWPDFSRIIGEVRPEVIFLENVPGVVKWALPTVLGDLSEMGYNAAWCVVAASDVGAPHRRKRWFLLAHSNGKRRGEVQSNLWSRKFNFEGGGYVADSEFIRGQQNNRFRKSKFINKDGQRREIISDWWKVEPRVGRMVDGVAHWVHRIRGCGNGVVPQQAAYAYRILMERLL